MAAWPERVAVVGAGTMGVGIGCAFAAAGIPTTLVDASPAQSEAALARAHALLQRFEAIGCLAASARDRGMAALAAAPVVPGEVDLVVEAVIERPEVKRAVYEQVEAVVGEEAVIATNTSSIPIAELASGLRRPERFLGVHWFVPPLLVPCVEVIAAPATDAGVVAEVVSVLVRLGKSPVVVGDGPGFVANRIQFAMFKEAAAIVEAGLATPAEVDEVVRSSFGFRLPFFGPFTIADMAGLDVYADVFATLERDLGESFRVPALVAERVAAGDLGAKTGGGFRGLTAEEAAELVERRDRAYLALGRLRAELER